MSGICSHNSRTRWASRSPSIFFPPRLHHSNKLYTHDPTRFAYYACDPSITAARIVGVRSTVPLPPAPRSKNTFNCSRRRTRRCAVPGDGNTTGSCIPRIRIRSWFGTTIRVVSPPRHSIGSIMAMMGGGRTQHDHHNRTATCCCVGPERAFPNPSPWESPKPHIRL